MVVPCVLLCKGREKIFTWSRRELYCPVSFEKLTHKSWTIVMFFKAFTQVKLLCLSSSLVTFFVFSLFSHRPSSWTLFQITVAESLNPSLPLWLFCHCIHSLFFMRFYTLATLSQRKTEHTCTVVFMALILPLALLRSFPPPTPIFLLVSLNLPYCSTAFNPTPQQTNI